MRTPAGSFVNDGNFAVTVIGATGTVVLPQPCAVHGTTSLFDVNVDTDRLNSGAYSVCVSFDSSTLTGPFATLLTKG